MESMEAEENSINMTNTKSNDNSENDSFYFSMDITMALNNPKLNVKTQRNLLILQSGQSVLHFPNLKMYLNILAF